ncbi:Tetratricopeptide repeat protein 39B [Blattella germanica]|nr:Tetratricopeptide repeat protein 39B [Blattella germanica]
MDSIDADDDFQDAYETQPVVSSMDLQTAMDEAKTAVHHFFNNKFKEARDILQPWANSSMYHSVGNSVFTFLEAMLTFEHQHIEAASEALKQCITVCNRYRKKNSISESLGKMVKKTNYDQYSPEEIHAELCYAEALLLKSMLTECSNILHQRNWGDESHKVHFESGVRMGIGAFNLMISLLPARVIKLLEFIGFSGSKLYPQGVWFLFFKGRLEFMKGNIEESVNWYTKSWKSQSMWPQFHHLCFWELIWTNSVKGEWREASKYADWLLHESRWSRTIYSYQKAAMLIMLGEDMSLDERTEVESLMRDAPQWKQRIAGKSLPMEKFAVRKTDRFFAQKKMLVLPAYELLYVWNLFKVLGKKRELIQTVYKTIEKTLAKLNSQKKPQEFDSDNQALVLLLKGASLRQMQSPLQAEECLTSVLALEKKIKEDHYLIPYAMAIQMMGLAAGTVSQ